MPKTYLTPDELTERDSLPYPDAALKYWYFFKKARWDKAQVDRQETRYTDNILACQSASNEVEEQLSERIKNGAKANEDGENDVTKHLPISRVREMFNAAGANYGDDVPDEAIAELVGRKL